jgi:CHAT domain-containing protein
MLLLAGQLASALADQPKEELTKELHEQLERRAAELEQQARQARQQRDYKTAVKAADQSLQIRERLYPRDKYPGGHHDLAVSLKLSGDLRRDQQDYERALPYYERALAICEALYPKDQYPQGHLHLVQSLNDLSILFQFQREFQRALPYAQQVLAMYVALFPKDKFPNGSVHLATSLHNLGSLHQAQGEYAQALPYLQRGLAMRQALYSKDQYPQGHRELALSLESLAALFQEQGDYGRALMYHQRALAMREALYPKDKYPHGHPELAASLNRVGHILFFHGDYGQALPYFQQALAMYQALYPKDQYPNGHHSIASVLNNLGAVLQSQDDYQRALPYYEQSLAMYQAIYPKDKYPRGHPELARILNNLGHLFEAQGDYGRALPYFQQALAIEQGGWLKEEYPRGNPDLAAVLNNFAYVLHLQGEYRRALPYYQQALAMLQALYPKDEYAHGHPVLATTLNNMGALLHEQGEYQRALPYYQQAMAMYHDEINRLADGAAEAQALNYAASLPGVRDPFLSATRYRSQPDPADYTPVWQGKAAITRILERRHLALLAAAESPETQERWQKLIDTRRQLSRLFMNPLQDRTKYKSTLQELTERKEKLESEVAQRLPTFGRWQQLDVLGPEDLAKKLPARCAFIDFLHYVYFEQDPKIPGKKGERLRPSYVAFVLSRAQPVQRVELGLADPIDRAITEWRREIEDQKTGPAAATLRRLVWDPLAKHIPEDTDTVYLAPDGALSRLPWAALPGRKPNTVLLEDHALALVPHGPFLLDKLIAPRKEPAEGLLLAVGGVQYDQAPRPADKRPDDLLAAHPAERGGTPRSWDFLKGSRQEVDQVLALAEKRPSVRRTGTEAGTNQVMQDLPKARWAHLATHGFFADAHFRTGMQLAEEDFKRGRRGERAGQGARSPLVLSGLVLAGANLPVKEAENHFPLDDGILSAEMIVGLPLEKLELAVLSACETGLGEEGGGEGVFGLQRAFHLAGTQNVIASLWRVNDEATAALMTLFYHNLWRENKPPLLALREAQLTLYRHPERIAELAKERGISFENVHRLAASSAKQTNDGQPPSRNTVKHWAGFMLSGLGR